MTLPVFVYDPTATDEASKVRGVGRYLQLLRDYLPSSVHFVDSIEKVPYESLFFHPFYNFLQPPLKYKRIARKQITVIHDLIPHKYPKEFPYGLKGLTNIILNTFMLRHYECLVTDSKHSANDICDMVKYPKECITIAYPCISKDFSQLLKKYKPSDKSPISKPYVVYVGDATWNKNLINLAQAIKIADIDAVFVGKNFIRSKMQYTLSHKPESGWLEELHGFYREVHDDPRFHLAGFVSDEKLIDLYHHAVANVLPSRDEGFGFSYLEAAVCGTPSVLGNTDIAEELADNTALYASVEDPVAIADAIKKYTDSSVRAEKKKLLKEHIKKFSPEQFAATMKTLIDSHSRID